MTTIVIDGRVVDAASASISVLDRGLLYGDGLFEVLRTWNGRAVDLDAHLDRLEESARMLRLPVDRAALVAAVALALRTAGDQRVRVIVTRGPGGIGVPMTSAGPGHTIVIGEPIGAMPEEMSLALVDWPLARRSVRGHKTLAYLDHVIAREMARDAGADDAVRLDTDGRVAEGGTCNVFCVRGGEVLAADGGGVLPGVTAARAAAICRRSGIPMRVGAIGVDEFLGADEIFTTSSVRGVVAVTRIIAEIPDGGRTLPCGVLTRRIRAAYVSEMTGL